MSKISTQIALSLLSSSLLAATFFILPEASAATDPLAAQAGSKAVAEVKPTAGNAVAGKVTFEDTAGGVQVHADLTGLSQGVHGFHIHEKGDCTAADGSSAGGHYNPTLAAHGAPTDIAHHSGDLGNITADANGHATLDFRASGLKTSEINGKAVIVHAQADDLKTQPTGNAGGRVACGVITGIN